MIINTAFLKEENLDGKMYIDGFVQERHNSIVIALELQLSYTNPLIYSLP